MSSPPLHQDHVLRREPTAQTVTLPDGRLLVRHRGGVSLLGGMERAEVERVVAAVDGRRTAGEICRLLAAELDPDRTRRLLRRLLGEVLQLAGHRQEGGGEEAGPPQEAEASSTAVGSGGPPATVVVLVNGRGGRRLAGELSRAGMRELLLLEIATVAACREEAFLAADRELRVGEPAPAPEQGEDRRERSCDRCRRLEEVTAGGLARELHGATLVICALEAVPYRALFEVQVATLQAGVPSLFLTADPDGLRLGPVTLAGVTPCLACAQLAALSALGLETAELLAVAGHLWSGRLTDQPAQEAAVRAAVAEAGRVLSPGAEPALTCEALLFTPAGGRRLPLPRLPHCPLCGGRPAATTAAAEDLRARVEPEIVARLEDRPARARVEEASRAVTSVGILGGGSAGYLTALALRRKLPHLAVTLIESSALGVIGVGEATTPLMPQFLHVDLGLDVHELFRRLRPTLKLGIRFQWGEAGSGDFHYPFGPVSPLEALAYEGDVRACSLQSLLMQAGAVEVEDNGGRPRSRLGTEVAYHLDNRRLVEYLKLQAGRAEVERIDATVERVELSPDGREVAALLTGDGRRLEHDFYVDCSGFKSLVLEEALGSPFRPFAKSLFTDRALVAPVPHGGRLKPYTLAESMTAGWCWNTPQEEADHRGYVYCSAFLSDDEAEAEMRRANPGMGEARRVRFRAGRHQHFWLGNVVALGNAYGFVEPLESTALHMLIRQIGLFVQAFPLGRREEARPALLNRRVAAFWDYLEWFLALHYRFNRHRDTPFWRHCRREVDVSACGELLAAYRERGPLSYDPLARATFDFPDPLWGPEGIDLLLLGQGEEGARIRPRLPRPAWDERMRLTRSIAGRALPQEQALPLLHQRPELLEAFSQAFRRAGPAFPV